MKKPKNYTSEQRLKIMRDFIKNSEKMEAIGMLQQAVENEKLFTDDVYNNLHDEIQRIENNLKHMK